jgi:hypothetical protein
MLTTLWRTPAVVDDWLYANTSKLALHHSSFVCQAKQKKSHNILIRMTRIRLRLQPHVQPRMFP